MYQQSSCEDVPKNEFSHVDRPDDFPGILYLDLSTVSTSLQAFCPPRKIIHPAQRINVQYYEVSWGVKREGYGTSNDLKDDPDISEA